MYLHYNYQSHYRLQQSPQFAFVKIRCLLFAHNSHIWVPSITHTAHLVFEYHERQNIAHCQLLARINKSFLIFLLVATFSLSRLYFQHFQRFHLLSSPRCTGDTTERSGTAGDPTGQEEQLTSSLTNRLVRLCSVFISFNSVEKHKFRESDFFSLNTHHDERRSTNCSQHSLLESI